MMKHLFAFFPISLFTFGCLGGMTHQSDPSVFIGVDVNAAAEIKAKAASRHSVVVRISRDGDVIQASLGSTRDAKSGDVFLLRNIEGHWMEFKDIKYPNIWVITKQ